MSKSSPSSNPLEKLAAFLGFLLSLVYLLNPTFGVFELIPDNWPLVGNLDEAGAVVLLIYCLAKLGVRVPGMPVKSPFKEKAPDKQRGNKDVIDV